jgi:2-succinyl-6-hydroxy-2,4-cyclohexadiene-1-carboxylate synthase
MLHGFTGSSDSWGSGTLRSLAARHRVLAVDLPGHGHSGAPARPDQYALSAIIEHLTGLLRATGIESATWVGYSMGGRLALGAAALHPELVDRLVLESASPGLATESERVARRRADETLARRIEDYGIEDFVEYWTDLPLFETHRRLPGEVRDALRRRRLANRPEALAACLRGLGTGTQPSFWDVLDRVRVPVLVVVGSDDSKYRAVGARMSDTLPAATLEIIPGAGHAPHLERPAEWLAVVEAFLDR